jgi:SAM-dependent methyltransferase
MTLEKEVSFFDAFEQEHGEYDVLAEVSYDRIIDAFFTGVPVVPGMTCVDLGCGTGAFTRRLCRLDLKLTGMDISPRSIDRARVVGGGPDYLVGDISQSALPPATFDFAVLSGVLHHLTASEDRVRTLREALRLLKPGGRVFSYDPNAASPSMWLYRHPSSPLYSSVGKTENEVLLSRRQLESELAQAGFVQTRARGLSGIAFRYVEGRLARKLLPLYNRGYEPLIRWTGLQSIFGTFVVATARRATVVSLHPND